MKWRVDKGREEFYREKKRKLWEVYWRDNDGTDIYRPNGFAEYPDEIYDLFLSLIDHGGKVLDLGCGNGLMLRHLVQNSEFEPEPHGVDFIEESIRQAREVVLPQFADNFSVANIVDVELEPSSFDFIFFDPYDVHPADIPSVVERILGACKVGGKVIFYTYRDVLEALGMEWVGDFLPDELSRELKRIDHPEVSVGVYTRKNVVPIHDLSRRLAV